MIEISKGTQDALEILDQSIKKLNDEKITLLFGTLGLHFDDSVLAGILDWDLILVKVPNRRIALQMNRLTGFVPNLKFVEDPDILIGGKFTVAPGRKGRRVWKER